MEKNRFGVVYKITNLVNGKYYIGQTTMKNPINRFKNHIYASRSISICMPIVWAIKNYGEKNFIFEIIHECYSRPELNQTEAFYIEKYDSCNKLKGYNIEKRSEDGRICTSEETREKMRINSNKPKNIERMINIGKKLRGSKRLYSKSKFIGVHAHNKKWQSVIQKGKERILLGFFILEEDAAKAHDIAELKYIGYNAKLNFPELLPQYLNNEIIVNRYIKKKSDSKIVGVSFCNTNKVWIVSIIGFKNKRFKNKENAENYAIECSRLKKDGKIPIYEKRKKKSDSLVVGVYYCNTSKRWIAQLKGIKTKKFTNKELAEKYIKDNTQ